MQKVEKPAAPQNTAVPMGNWCSKCSWMTIEEQAIQSKQYREAATEV